MKTIELTPKEFYEFKELWAKYYSHIVYHMTILKKGSVLIETDSSRLLLLGY